MTRSVIWIQRDLLVVGVMSVVAANLTQHELLVMSAMDVLIVIKQSD